LNPLKRTTPKEILEPVVYQADYFQIRDRRYNDIEWDYCNWTGFINSLDSREGYKIKCNLDVKFPISGQKVPDNTIIELKTNGRNWVGYFIEEPMTIQIALHDIWDNVTAVYSED